MRRPPMHSMAEVDEFDMSLLDRVGFSPSLDRFGYTRCSSCGALSVVPQVGRLSLEFFK
jgi:hypothetical protein